MILRDRLRQAEQQLLTSPHPDRARKDAESLASFVLQQNRAWLLASLDEEAPASLDPDFSELVARRKTGEPLQYITGSSEFFGLPFSVGPGVLIPRPETEHLVEEVLRLAKDLPYSSIADIGTGSGIIAVALASALPHAQITAIDCSAQALLIARENAALNQVESRITFLEGDLLTPLAGQLFEIIASNPPYIPTADHDSLAVEVRDHEPHSALFAGSDGLDLYRRLIPEAIPLLKPNAWLVLEIGYNQQAPIEQLLREFGYQDIHFIPDYQGIPRVAVGQRIQTQS